MFLATHVRQNVRELEGCLIRLSAFGSLSGTPITTEMAREVLKNIIPDRNRSLTIEAIQKLVADHYNIKISDLKSPRRLRVLTVPRQIAMYLARQMTESSLNTIGEAFGGRDHGTVLHACRLVRDRMQVDPSVRQKVSFLERQLMR